MHGGFTNWLTCNHPMAQDDWVDLFRKHFKFTGNKITSEFLVSIGYLPGAHTKDCEIYKKIIQSNPPWYQNLISNTNMR